MIDREELNDWLRDMSPDAASAIGGIIARVEVELACWKDDAVALEKNRNEWMQRYDDAAQLVKKVLEPKLVAAERRLREVEADLVLVKELHPTIYAQLAGIKTIRSLAARALPGDGQGEG